jgi:hypothetical protein
VSERITKKWTKTTAEAFGDNVKTRAGYNGEKIIYDYLVGVYDKVIWNESDRRKQINGIDFEFKKDSWYNFYTADVKANLKEKIFFVYPEEIKNKKNHRMIHVDVDTGFAVEYDRKSMLEYLDTLKSDTNYFRLNTSDKSLKRNVAYFRVFRARKTQPTLESVSLALNNYDLPE